MRDEGAENKGRRKSRGRLDGGNVADGGRGKYNQIGRRGGRHATCYRWSKRPQPSPWLTLAARPSGDSFPTPDRLYLHPARAGLQMAKCTHLAPARSVCGCSSWIPALVLTVLISTDALRSGHRASFELVASPSLRAFDPFVSWRPEMRGEWLMNSSATRWTEYLPRVSRRVGLAKACEHTRASSGDPGPVRWHLLSREVLSSQQIFSRWRN